MQQSIRIKRMDGTQTIFTWKSTSTYELGVLSAMFFDKDGYYDAGLYREYQNVSFRDFDRIPIDSKAKGYTVIKMY